MFAMRCAWIAAVGLFGLACFSPTDIEVASVSETGDTGSTDATMGDDSMSDDDPSMSSANTMTDPTDPSTMTDPTSADSSGTTDAPTTTDDPSTTGTTAGGPMCMSDDECPAGMCIDGECMDNPPPGDPYGPCDSCDEGELALSFMDIAGCYCSPSCAMHSDCPAPADGTATPECAVINEGPEPSLCALLCDPTAMGICPAGSNCEPIPLQEGAGVCMYPI